MVGRSKKSSGFRGTLNNGSKKVIYNKLKTKILLFKLVTQL